MESGASNTGLGGETSQTMDRGLALLDLLSSGEHPLGLTVTELAQALGVGRPVVYRLVASLAQHDYVVRHDDGRIRLGIGLIRLSASVLPVLRDAAIPVLRTLADRVHATAHLVVADRSDAVAVAVVEPSRSDLHIAYRIGSRHSLHAGAAGRAILLGRGVERLDDPERPAYVVSDGELQTGAHGLAAPVLGLPGLEASVGVVSLQAFDDATVGPLVVAGAARLAHVLG
ncbi:IclR family transcriptional regulator [Luteipulveratus halotolerans]|uniref:IclR family transcriptional regulator n=1 Tax=Luteipulveratus halotolerans TaxID=1631356 RepID=A0A0L6CIN9_9MICO|nr:helix-turn-helix domain-containing protein [Luteipulveratus halotolerans]KNX37667.1 IclR family transcriptional regulator [Luteipulveratus halotolerans]